MASQCDEMMSYCVEDGVDTNLRTEIRTNVLGGAKGQVFFMLKLK